MQPLQLASQKLNWSQKEPSCQLGSFFDGLTSGHSRRAVAWDQYCSFHSFLECAFYHNTPFSALRSGTYVTHFHTAAATTELHSDHDSPVCDPRCIYNGYIFWCFMSVASPTWLPPNSSRSAFAFDNGSSTSPISGPTKLFFPLTTCTGTSRKCQRRWKHVCPLCWKNPVPPPRLKDRVPCQPLTSPPRVLCGSLVISSIGNLSLQEAWEYFRRLGVLQGD